MLIKFEGKLASILYRCIFHDYLIFNFVEVDIITGIFVCTQSIYINFYMYGLHT